MKRTLNVKLLAGAALVVVVGGYFGLKAYAAHVADGRLRDWLFEHRLQDKISWQSLSSSPLGGTIKLHEVRISDGPSIAQLTLSDLKDEPARRRADVQFEGVAFPPDAKGRSTALRLPLVGDLLLASGRAELAPFSGRLKWNVEDELADIGLTLDLPELLDVDASLSLAQVRRLAEDLSDMAENGQQVGQRGLLSSFGLLGKLQQSAQRAELKGLQVDVKDQGYFKRSLALTRRYLPLDPTAGDFDKQRDRALAAAYQQQRNDCLQDFQSLGARGKDLCKGLVDLASGEEDGLRVSLAPKERVRLGDTLQVALTAALDPAGAAGLLDRLNLESKSL